MVKEDNTVLVIGRTTLIDFIDQVDNVPAKIDTGADSSSVWASQINVDRKGVLTFVLFDKQSPYYTGKVITRTDYGVATVRSSNGHEQVRYFTTFSVRIKGRRYRVRFYLSDRSRNTYPILLGRRTLNGKFLVDVSHSEYELPNKKKLKRRLTVKLRKNPRLFHLMYHSKSNRKRGIL